jgi:hypothetical protein
MNHKVKPCKQFNVAMQTYPQIRAMRLSKINREKYFEINPSDVFPV